MEMLPREKLTCRQRLCNLTRADLNAFEDLLRTRFPDLLCYEYDSFHWCAHILDRLGDAEFRAEFCRSPSGYTEEPEDPHTAGQPQRRCLPRGTPPAISVIVSEPEHFDLSDFEPGHGIPAIDCRGRRLNPTADMQGCCPRDDVVSKKFFGAVFRMAARFMTSRFDVYDLETGKHLRTFKGHGLWCGPEGIRLSREDPQFFTRVHFSYELNTWCGLKALPME